MAPKKNTKRAKKRTKVVSIQPEKVIEAPISETFHLNVAIPLAAHEVIQNQVSNSTTLPDATSIQKSTTQAAAKEVAPQREVKPVKKPVIKAERTLKHRLLNIKIWNTLEWVATSALIFMVLFFLMNINAYGTLLIDKLNQIRGTVQQNPVIQNLTHTAAVTQQPLPILATADQNKKQIPYMDIEIAPPDDRVIIPRIGKNVPVVNVKTENLIKRDWGALEADIQKALQYGVVHYPGTSQPGENGNVVITGHSSYFAWDPGRFKDVFSLLQNVKIGDTVLVYHNQKKYTYQIYSTEIITPEKVDVLTQNGDNRLTLITCWPVGTNLKRLVVFAKPV